MFACYSACQKLCKCELNLQLGFQHTIVKIFKLAAGHMDQPVSGSIVLHLIGHIVHLAHSCAARADMHEHSSQATRLSSGQLDCMSHWLCLHSLIAVPNPILVLDAIPELPISPTLLLRTSLNN